MMMSTHASRVMRLTLLACLSIFINACDDTINIDNAPPTAVIHSLQVDGGKLAIFYDLSDAEGDDVAIVIEVCQQAACISPTAAAGGDGTENLPTVAGESVLHLFAWAAACDVTESQFDLERVIHITPRDDGAGTQANSTPFNLADLSVAGGTDACQDALAGPGSSGD